MNMKDRSDSTEWLDSDQDCLNSNTSQEIYDIVYANQGCADMHYKVVFSDGETLSLAVGV